MIIHCEFQQMQAPTADCYAPRRFVPVPTTQGLTVLPPKRQVELVASVQHDGAACLLRSKLHLLADLAACDGRGSSETALSEDLLENL